MTTNIVTLSIDDDRTADLNLEAAVRNALTLVGLKDVAEIQSLSGLEDFNPHDDTRCPHCDSSEFVSMITNEQHEAGTEYGLKHIEWADHSYMQYLQVVCSDCDITLYQHPALDLI